MTGTWVNVGAILLGSLLGILLKKGVPERINSAVMKAEGLAIGVISLNGIIASMFRSEGGKLSDSGGLLLLVSLVIGCLLGELARFDERIDRLGLLVEQRLKTAGFAKGLVTATLIFCIGAMGIMGALDDGLKGDSSILFVKSTLDFTTSIILAASLGVGVAFSAIPVLLMQGSISLLAQQLSVYLTIPMRDSLCMVGYSLVLCIGLNFLLDAKIKVVNLLPALLVPILYHLVR